jgi:hypothetical protein
LDKHKTARYLGTLGVAYAAQLQFPKAIKCEEEALKINNGYDSGERARAMERVALYAQKLPYYDEQETVDP